jgi:hypothetical protein
MERGIKKLQRLLLLAICCIPAVLACTGVQVARAESQFSPDQGIWDVSGNYANDEFDVANQIHLTQDDKGKITGYGTAFASDSGIDVWLVHNFTGSIKSASNGARVLLTMRISGSATDGVTALPITGNIKLFLDLDKATNLLVGSGKGNICVQRRCAKVDEPVQFDVPQPMDGTWTLALNLPSVGTATATLSNGRTMLFTQTGGYQRNRPARFDLTGPAGKIRLVGNGIDLGLTLAKAKLLGQSIAP